MRGLCPDSCRPKRWHRTSACWAHANWRVEGPGYQKRQVRRCRMSEEHNRSHTLFPTGDAATSKFAASPPRFAQQPTCRRRPRTKLHPRATHATPLNEAPRWRCAQKLTPQRHSKMNPHACNNRSKGDHSMVRFTREETRLGLAAWKPASAAYAPDSPRGPDWRHKGKQALVAAGRHVTW